MLLNIDFSSKESLYIQVKEQLKSLIKDGSLAYDSKLPSSRELASALHISRNTVNKVYGELMDEGYLKTRTGTGTFVCYDTKNRGLKCQDSETDTFEWQEAAHGLDVDLERFSERIAYFYPDRKDKIAFTNSRPLPEFYAFERFRKCLNDILALEGAKLLDYGPTMGYEPLRRYLSGYLANKGILAEEEEILVVNGFQQGLSLLGRLILKPGDTVITEDPTHSNALDTFRSMGASVTGIPIVDSDGIDMELLGKKMKEKKPSLLYIIPSNHNPTGLTMSIQKRLDLMQLIEKYDVPVLEDAFSEELRFAGQVVPPLKALDKRGRVVYIGSFSKILFPGIRVGWIVASKALISRLVYVKRMTDISTSLLNQASLAEFCSRGYFENEIKRVRKIYRERLHAVLEAMKQYMPKEVKWTGGTGGFSIWVTLPENMDAEELLQHTAPKGVIFIPGKYFSVTGRKNCFRLSFSSLSLEEIHCGIGILSECIKS